MFSVKQGCELFSVVKTKFHFGKALGSAFQKNPRQRAESRAKDNAGGVKAK